MALSTGDKQVVFNIRFELKDKVEKYTDEEIAQTWRDFSQSEDYAHPDRMNKFLEWLPDLNQK
jgi:hypothetical protein